MRDLSGKVSKDATAKETLRNDFVVMLADNNFENVTIKQFKRYKYPSFSRLYKPYLLLTTVVL